MQNYFIQNQVVKSFFYFLVIVSVSCKTDFDVYEPWQNIPIVYCILNQNDSVHYVRIQKAFTAKSDNERVALINDSIYYSQQITVYIESWNNNNLEELITFEPTTDIQKDVGTFSNSYHLLYKSTSALSSNNKYKLQIEFPDDTKNISATTELIKDFNINAETRYFFSRRIKIATYSNFPLGWKTSKNAKIFKPIIILNYLEIEGYDTSFKSISWPLPSFISLSTNGNENVNLKILNKEFYQYIGSSLKETDYYTKRIAQNIDIKFNVGTEDLRNYIELSKPSPGYLIDIPNFSNLSNGYGIFSARYNKYFKGNLLSGNSLDSLSCGMYTKHLNFVDRYENLHACE